MFIRHAASGAISAAVIAVPCASANAEPGPVLASTGPFLGDLTETFNQHGSTMAVQSLPVFAGTATLDNTTDGGAIKVEFSSAFNGDLVTPLSGMMAGQLGIGHWIFDEPVLKFGGWWENNSGADDATVAFYGINDVFLGEMIADVAADAQQWTWNGWESTEAITRVEVTGNGVFNGFLWYDDMQVEYVPAPGAAALLLTAALLRSPRKRRMPGV